MVKTRNIDTELMSRMADILKCIAHPVRLSIVELLEEHERLNVTELREHVSIEQSLLSHHLIKMKDRGILVAERQGKNIYYTLKDRNIVRIFDCMEKCDFL
ncbi:MAG: ArsR/SmtB family transcription factor [Bernardetiaceae bacterium]